MSKILWKSLLATPAILSIAFIFSLGANAAESYRAKEASQTEETYIAQGAPTADAPAETPNNQELLDQINRYSQEDGDNLGQVNSVSQLRDVSPGDWAFEALRNLVERYGCIAGFPNGTYRGNQPLTRYEFAAGLNACLQQIERLIAASGGSDLGQGDLSQIQRLTQEF